MISVSNVKNMVIKCWGAEFRRKSVVLPPNAKFITGVVRNDAFLHYLETECGIELELAKHFTDMSGYNVLDKRKFLMFTIKWS